MYFAQSNGVAYYTMTGGPSPPRTNTQVTLANGVSTQGYFTINGPQALARFPSLSLDTGVSGIGGWTLENGRLAVDSLSTMSSSAAPRLFRLQLQRRHAAAVRQHRAPVGDE